MREIPIAQGLAALDLRVLIPACAEGRTRHWEELVRRLQPVIASTVYHATRRFSNKSDDLVDDLVQETFLRLCADGCRVLREFEAADGEAIFALVRTVAFNTTMDYFRGELALKRGAGQAELPIDAYTENVIPDTGEADQTERRVLMQEIDAHLAHCAVRAQDRRIFWLHYRHGMGARSIAGVAGAGLSQKGVESVLRRLTEEVKGWMAGRRVKTSHTQQKFEGKLPAGSI